LIIPAHAEEEIEANGMKALFQHYPHAFFGYFIRYPKQAHIVREWLRVRPKICVISGAKRTAKTSVGAFLGTCWATGKVDPNWWGCKAMGISDTYTWGKRFEGERVGIIAGNSLDHVENVLLKMYESMIPPSAVKDWFSKTNKRIELHGKIKFLIRTYEQELEAWKSGTSQFTHLDEEPPWEVMEEVMNRSRTTQGKILITVAVDDADVSWLPDACDNPKKVLGTDSFMHFKLGVEDVPTDIYPQVEKESIYAQYDHTPLRLAVRKGEFVGMAGKWWPEFNINIHVIKPFPIPPAWKRIRAVDAGVAAPSACAWAALHPSNIIFIYREYYKPGTTIAQRCKDIIEASGNTRRREQGIWWEVNKSEEYELTLLDHAEFKTDQVTGDGLDYEYVKEGLPVQPWTTLGQEGRREITRKWLWPDYKEKHFISGDKGAPRIYFFDTCPNLIWEAQRKSFKTSRNPRSSVVEKKIQNRDDHLLDCVEGICSEMRWMIDDRVTI
jgi:phage terminase large subunit-like protein